MHFSGITLGFPKLARFSGLVKIPIPHPTPTASPRHLASGAGQGGVSGVVPGSLGHADDQAG